MMPAARFPQSTKPVRSFGPEPQNALATARQYTVSVRMRKNAPAATRYIARVLEFPDLVTYAGSEYRALHRARESIRAAILVLTSNGEYVPTPSPEDDLTGD